MKRTVICCPLLLAVALWSTGLSAQTKPGGLVVHEWGTFTSLQDESGRAIGGINTDDEPVPKFVHRLADFLLLGPTEVPATFFQGAPHCHPDVTMRLETPVLYFHPSPAQSVLQQVSVSAKFRGGWLSEYYPKAEATAPGLERNSMTFGPLPATTVSSLAWNNLELGGDKPGPVTAQHVWTAPRAVRAATVSTPDGESEKFLFYRGVGHIDAPIAITRDGTSTELVLQSQCPPEIAGREPLTLKSLWLVDIGQNHRVAFRVIPPVTLDGETKVLAKVSSHFASVDYSDANRDKLKKSLQAALVSEGLFDDEAQALLNTWELSYFKSAGLRVFFLVPRAWTDFYLPLNISPPAETTRVMVGRIELITPEQRDHLRQIAQFTQKNITNEAARLQSSFYGQIAEKAHSTELSQVNAGGESLAAFGVSTPGTYLTYLALGRFRNALILDEARKHPSPGLASFISTYGLEGYNTDGP